MWQAPRAGNTQTPGVTRIRRPASQGRRPPSQGSIRGDKRADHHAEITPRSSKSLPPPINRGPPTPWGNHQRGLHKRGSSGYATPRSDSDRHTNQPFYSSQTKPPRGRTPRTPFSAPVGVVDLEDLVDSRRPAEVAVLPNRGPATTRRKGLFSQQSARKKWTWATATVPGTSSALQ